MFSNSSGWGTIRRYYLQRARKSRVLPSERVRQRVRSTRTVPRKRGREQSPMEQLTGVSSARARVRARRRDGIALGRGPRDGAEDFLRCHTRCTLSLAAASTRAVSLAGCGAPPLRWCAAARGTPPQWCDTARSAPPCGAPSRAVHRRARCAAARGVTPRVVRRRVRSCAPRPSLPRCSRPPARSGCAPCSARSTRALPPQYRSWRDTCGGRGSEAPKHRARRAPRLFAVYSPDAPIAINVRANGTIQQPRQNWHSASVRLRCGSGKSFL